MQDFDINDLIVIHRAKDAAGGGFSDVLAKSLRAQGFFLDTCLRQLAIPTSAAASRMQSVASADSNAEFFSGTDAYRFLLETAAGLNSAVPAETNVFGQFQHAWKTYLKKSATRGDGKLVLTIELLFADTRDIRRTYLQGIGGTSYGSLVRKLLQAAPGSRLLWVGMGRLALSMLPFFKAYATAGWNHRDIQPDATPSLRRFRPDEVNAAARWANHLILTTPADDVNDRLWAGLANEGGIDRIIHLGRRHDDPGPWAGRHEFLDLDHVFELRRSQSNVRSLQLQRARRACRQQAESRALMIAAAEPARQRAIG